MPDTEVMESVEVSTDQPTGSVASLFSGPASREESGGKPSEKVDTRQDEGETPAEAETAPDGKVEGKAEDNKYLAQLWKELGITNPDDPEQLQKVDLKKLAKRIADKDAYIEKLKTQGGQPEAKALDFTEGLGIKAKEEPATKQTTEAAPAQKTDMAAPAAAELKFGDDYDWKDAEAAETAINEAFAEGSLGKVAEMQNALFLRRAQVMVLPLVEKLVTERLEGRFKELEEKDRPAISAYERQQQQQQAQDDREWVMSALSSVEDLKDIVSGLHHEDEGSIVIPEDFPEENLRGQKFANTPYNRLVIKNPWLLKVNESDQNPRVAERKTLYTRWKLAAEIAKRETQPEVDPKKAKELVDAGREMQARESKDRTRQTLNAGRGATTAGGKNADYAEELNNLPGVGSVAQLWSGRR